MLKSENNSTISNAVDVWIKTDSKIYNDPEFQRAVEVGSLYYKMLTWADTAKELNEPSIYFMDDGQVLLSKQGYNLPTANWRKYKDSGDMNALLDFKRDLFGTYAECVQENMKNVFEWVDVEEPEKEISDFIITVSFEWNFTTGKEKRFFLQALHAMNIDKETEE